jgi:hypothetical protein
MAKLAKRYIIHDESASRDEKILKMREKYGARGTGLFWEILEQLFSNNGMMERNPKIVSMAIGEDVRTVTAFLTDCIEVYHLFESDGNYFWSNRLRSQIDQIVAISEKRSNAALKKHANKHDKSKGDNDLTSTTDEEASCTCIAGAEHMQCNDAPINKLKEIDEINNCYGESGQRKKFKKPSIEEIEAYCTERENTVDPIQFYDYYEANGWRVGKNPMKDWKAAVRTWERNDNGGKKSKVVVQNDPYAELRLI